MYINIFIKLLELSTFTFSVYLTSYSVDPKLRNIFVSTLINIFICVTRTVAFNINFFLIRFNTKTVLLTRIFVLRVRRSIQK